jgi:UDP-N-acetylmuramoyl-tripeptide--D-alanyl-D-alanine ligase
LLWTPLGRALLSDGIFRRLWPLLAQLATVHRRLLARRTRIVAVVGSFGKTSTTRALRRALATRAHLDVRGNAYSSLARGLLAVRPTDRWAVLEVGIDGPGQMARYARILRPNLVVVTSIGSEHHNSLHTLERTRHEKAEMLRELGPDGLAVVNGDDPHVRWMAGQTRARVVRCGLGPDNDLRATDLELRWPTGLHFTLNLEGRAVPFQSRLLGRHQLFSLLAAVAVGRDAGVPAETYLERLTGLEPVDGRLQLARLTNGALLLCDHFKGALETYDAALDLLAEIPARRKIAIVGDVSEPPGSQGTIYRRLGARLAQQCSRIIVVGQQLQRYAAGATAAGLPRAAILSVGRDPLRAAELLRDELGPGDLVLIKGRDTQRMERIALALSGQAVGCHLVDCHLPRGLSCGRCPALRLGWVDPVERKIVLGRLRLGRDAAGQRE